MQSANLPNTSIPSLGSLNVGLGGGALYAPLFLAGFLQGFF